VKKLKQKQLFNDFESHLLKLDYDIEKAKKNLSVYTLALKAVASPKPK
jgi:hypothetical protein